MPRILFVITEDWALATHRLHLVKAAQANGHSVAVATRVDTLRHEFEALGILVFNWRLKRRSMNLVREILVLNSLHRIIKEFKPDLIHAVALKPVIYSGFITKLGFKGGVVLALGGIGYIFSNNSLKAKILRIPIKLMLRSALVGHRRRLILQNPDDVAHFLGSGVIDSNKIRLVKGAGVETEIFTSSPLPEGDPIIVLPSRLLWDKGIFEFYTVAKRLKRYSQSAKFVIVGDPDHHNPATIPDTFINEWTASGIVENWQRVGHSDMPEIYRQALIVCLPSYREGLPKVLLEAASSSRPIVAFDVAGCREVVRPGINGSLVPFGDVDMLENAILDLMNSRVKCATMGENGRKIIEKEFSSEVVNKQTFEIWDEVIN